MRKDITTMTHVRAFLQSSTWRTLLSFLAVLLLLALAVISRSSSAQASSTIPRVTLATVVFTYYNPDGSVNTAAITVTLASTACTTVPGAPTEEFTTGVSETVLSTEPVKVFDNTACTSAGLIGVLSPGEVRTAYKTTIFAVQVGA